jgi:hypothetical protein
VNALFDSPDTLDRFVTEVRADLEARGFAIAARRLAEVQGRVYTTRSEWLAELGVAVQAIRNQHGLPANLRDKLDVIRAEVRRAGPGQ